MNRSRRAFIQTSAGCAGYLLTGLALAPASTRRAFAAEASGKIVAEEEFARIEALAENVWAVVSTPLKDGGRHFTTTSNGGIIAGRDGVLVVEGFYTDEGAAWLARQVRELTGREPTHAVVTHYHADHCHGLGGLVSERPKEEEPLRMLSTSTTRELMVGKEEKVLPDPGIPEDDKTTKIDLGGRTVRVVSRLGHTPSDVTVEISDPKVVFCGDLVWNGMFPNYVDAIPSHLTRHCEKVLGRKKTTYVPGHGDVGDAAALDSYLAMIKDVESHARRAIEAGTPAATAAAEYAIPESLGEWVMFSPSYFERAFAAWEKEFRAGS